MDPSGSETMIVENIQSVFAGHNDILATGSVQIHHLKGDTGTFTHSEWTRSDRMFYKSVTTPFIVVEAYSIIGSGIATIMRPVTLSRHQLRLTISINIHPLHCVELLSVRIDIETGPFLVPVILHSLLVQCVS